MQKVSRKEYKEGVLVQAGGGVPVHKGVQEGVQEGYPVQEGGVPVGFLGQFLATKGGVPIQEGGSCGVSASLPLHILPSQFLAGFHFKCNAKGRCQFPWQCRLCDPVLGSGG